MSDASASPLDDETTAALTLFNEYVAADRERERRERRVKKAERAKDDAAAAIKKLEGKGASAEEKAAAETTYREALEMWKRLRDGRESEPEAAADDAPSETPPEAEVPEAEVPEAEVPEAEAAEGAAEPGEPHDVAEDAADAGAAGDEAG